MSLTCANRLPHERASIFRKGRRELKNLQYFLEYLGFRVVGASIGAMPVEFASAFSGKLWRWIAPLLYRHRRALDNLARAFPEKTAAECEAIARDMWENLGRTFAEAFHLRDIAYGDRIVVKQPGLLDAMAAGKQGSIFCAAHLANWELSPFALVKHGLRPASVYQKLKNPYVERFVLEVRGFLHPGGLYPKDRNAVRLLTQHARAGGVAGVLTDLRDWSGIKIDFFGMVAPTTPFPAHLAHFLDLPLFVVIFVRKTGVRFECAVEEIAVCKTGDRRADVRATTAAIHQVIERAIRAHPEQWMWGHRRWG